MVEKKTTTEAKPSATKPESEQKNECKRERQEGAMAAEATGASGTSRNVVRLIDCLVGWCLTICWRYFNQSTVVRNAVRTTGHIH